MDGNAMRVCCRPMADDRTNETTYDVTTAGNASRGSCNSRIGFILAAAGSAVGLGNIWGFPTQVADNGGAAFILIYLVCCLAVGFPVMVAEFTIGRYTGKNPVGAFRDLSGTSALANMIVAWEVICGVKILSFYLVLSAWTFGYVVEEVSYFVRRRRSERL